VTSHSLRGVVLFALLALGGAAIAARLVELQLLMHEPLDRQARINSEDRMHVAGPRGEIVDRDARILAISVPTKLLLARPVDISAAGLHAIDAAAGTPGRLSSRQQRKSWIRVTNSCDYLCEEKIARLVKEGFVPAASVHLEPTFRRRYPNGSLAAQVIGFINDEGQAHGIEGQYDGLLRAQEHELLLLRDAREKIIDARRIDDIRSAPVSLMLTLDLRVQEQLETALRETAHRHKARSAQGVVIDPKTGEILAMATWPTFDPNHFGAGFAHHRNLAIGASFEPGSVIKPLSAVAVVDSGVVDPYQRVFCERGSWKAAGCRRPIRDHSAYEWLTLPEVLTVSSNIGIAKYSSLIPARRLHETLRAFGIGEKTGIDLPAEARGTLLPIEKWQGRDRYAAAFGYLMRTSPLQLAVAYAAIANGGLLVRPHLARATSEGGRSWHPVTTSKVRRRVASAAAVRSIASWLQQVVTNERGTGGRALVAGYRVAGKTGTAEKLIKGHYDRRSNIATFAGFAPAEDPRVVIVVSLDNPQEHGRDAGSVAAPAFARVMAETLRLWHIAPTIDHQEVARARATRRRNDG